MCLWCVGPGPTSVGGDRVIESIEANRVLPPEATLPCRRGYDLAPGLIPGLVLWNLGSGFRPPLIILGEFPESLLHWGPDTESRWEQHKDGCTSAPGVSPCPRAQATHLGCAPTPGTSGAGWWRRSTAGIGLPGDENHTGVEAGLPAPEADPDRC